MLERHLLVEHLLCALVGLFLKSREDGVHVFGAEDGSHLFDRLTRRADAGVFGRDGRRYDLALLVAIELRIGPPAKR